MKRYRSVQTDAYLKRRLLSTTRCVYDNAMRIAEAIDEITSVDMPFHHLKLLTKRRSR
jgi:hypothetical protein